MELKYTSFMENVYDKFSALKSVPEVDSSIFDKITLDELLNLGFVNYTASKKQLYRLSRLIENYAVKQNSPLMAAFENESKFKYAEERYLKMMKKLPMTWIIGNFNNPFLAQEFPKNAKTISCVGTNLDTLWIVISKGPAGPMGLVADELVDGNFRGFFSIAPAIIQKTIEIINYTLREDIDINKQFE